MLRSVFYYDIESFWGCNRGMTITKEVFQYLINHIRELQDKKISIVNVFALDYDEFMTMLDLVNADIKRIENYLDNARIGTDQHALPFVIIGSVVHVIEQKDDKVYKYRINLPDKSHQIQT